MKKSCFSLRGRNRWYFHHGCIRFIMGGIRISSDLMRVSAILLHYLVVVFVSKRVVMLSRRIAYLQKNGAHAEQSGCAPMHIKNWGSNLFYNNALNNGSPWRNDNIATFFRNVKSGTNLFSFVYRHVFVIFQIFAEKNQFVVLVKFYANIRGW